MTTKQLIISSFIRFKDLKEARNVPFWKAIVYLLVLSIIMALPISFQVFQVLNNIQLDGQRLLLAFLILQSKTGSFKPKKRRIHLPNKLHYLHI